MPDNIDYSFSISLVGGTVGKKSLLKRYVSDKFDQDSKQDE